MVAEYCRYYGSDVSHAMSVSRLQDSIADSQRIIRWLRRVYLPMLLSAAALVFFVFYQISQKKAVVQVYASLAGLLLAACFVLLFFVLGRVSRSVQENLEALGRCQYGDLPGLAGMEFHDALTALPNRLMMMERLAHAVKKSDRYRQSIALAHVHIDRFAALEERLGSIAARTILKSFAVRLQKIIRECDTVARTGEYDFLVILESIKNSTEAAQVAARITKSFSDAYEYQGERLSLSASIGLSVYPEESKTIDELLEHAGMAVGKVIDRGGNAYQFYTKDMNARTMQRLSKEQELRRAIENNEFVLFYQPKVEVMSCRVIGMEALIRWRNKDGSLTYPDEFIALLEECGLILQVGEWVIREACNTVKKWTEEYNPELKVAVNVSAKQFRSLDFVERVAEILEQSGLPARNLELEVTEGVLMEDTQASAEVLRALKSLGISVAIDDFGTGYSSLSYLQKYPIDTLKIDRAFVSDIGIKNEGTAITTTIVSLAHNLRLNIVAEGVETPNQLTFLAALGCHQVQGFLFSKPVGALEFERLLSDESVLFQDLKKTGTPG